MAADHGPDEAARRYRAIVLTTLRQLRGLADARIRLTVDPADGHEAVRFWLLPRLADDWRSEGGVFANAGWEIDFGGQAGGFSIEAAGEILCPYLGARWVHAALLGLGRSTGRVIGPATGGGRYFHAEVDAPADSPERILPELPVVRTSADWLETLASPLGPALKRAWEEEA